MEITQHKKLIQLAVSAGMALLFVNYYLKSRETTIENGYNMVSVLTASRDIPPHTALDATMLSVKDVPLKFVQPGVILVKFPGQEIDRIKGKVTISAIPEGTQITQANLSTPALGDVGIAPLIPPGKRGFLLRLGNLDVAQLILPGDHIDVMATFTVRQKDNSQSKATYTILQNILVVGVGKDIKPRNLDIGAKKEIVEGLMLTLAVEAAEAERLALAQAESQGEISVTVRPHGDDSTRPVPGATPAGLVGQ